MGIEKIAGSGVEPYQGSTVVSTTAAQGVDPAAQPREIPEVESGAYGNKGTTGEVADLENKKLKDAVNDLNKRLINSEAVFGVHEKTNRIMIKIVDKTTREVIKEYPPEQTLDIIAKAWEIAGLLVDEKG